MKTRLFAAGLKSPRCELCGQGEEWRGRRLSLILDQINGVRDDHRLENLRIVCPNCAATLETHCGRNVKRVWMCATCGEEFTPESGRRRFCSPRCRYGSEASERAHTAARRVERPPYEQLVAEVAATSWRAVGRRYGVTDNAVRKWVRWYEARQPAPGADASR